ncbi:acyl-CoA thioesterase [Mesonia mobilis]|nr:acyl-CoA thioesterase [Mesonia mobilis]
MKKSKRRMTPIPFQYEIEVQPEHIDDLKHVNNVTYLQWVQDVGEKHWNLKTSEELREKYGWVVLNHFIEYKSPAFLNEKLILKTWIQSHEGVKSERRVEVIRKKDNKIIAQAKTLWCLIEKQSHRPARITPEITEPFFED